MSDYFANLHQARTLHARRKFESAVQYCTKAVKEKPGDPRGWTLYGAIRSAQGLHLQARDAYAAAVKTNPKDPSLLLNLGSALKQLGAFDDARNCFEQAIAIEKTFAPAYYTLSSIKRFQAGDSQIGEFEELKKKTAGYSTYKLLACFSLGKIYDDIGEWDRAFENYTEGNALRCASYDHRFTLAFFEKVKKTFTCDMLAKCANMGNPARTPIFIIGMPRSGSSLIEEILSRSEGVYGLGEPSDIAELFYKSTEKNLNVLSDPAALYRIGNVYLTAMAKIAPNAERHVDKNLLNHSMVGFIRLILPESSLIHTKRNPIDTCLSCYFQNFTYGHEYSFNLVNLAKLYAAYTDLMRHWDKVFGNEIFTASYERVISNRDEEIAKLYAHVGLIPPDKETISQPADRAIPTASAWQARQPIYKSSVKRWKNYEKHLGPLFKALEESGFDYERVG